MDDFPVPKTLKTANLSIYRHFSRHNIEKVDVKYNEFLILKIIDEIFSPTIYTTKYNYPLKSKKLQDI